MKALFLVFVGGGSGSLLRYGISRIFQNTDQTFPLATLAANSLGSLLIGMLIGLAVHKKVLSDHASLLLITGFCGGFTTFSTFALENHILIKDGNLLHFALYTILSIVVALLLVYLGIWLTK